MAINDLKYKKIWELSPSEIEYIYSNLHMNNYVYAALMTFHLSNMPLNKIIGLRKENIPDHLLECAQKLIYISPYLGNENPKIVRINYTYYAFNLFRYLKHINHNTFDQTIEFLATIAYISIVADKNDNLLIWKNFVVREKNHNIQNTYSHINEDIDINSFVELPFLFEGKKPIFERSLIDQFVSSAVRCIIIMIENNIDYKEAAIAFKNVEKNMLRHENENIDENAHNKFEIFAPGPLRHRNTLYLYGGNLFERMKRYDDAFSWYTKFLYSFDTINKLPFYLTALKMCERLLCAYRVASSAQETFLLKDLIKHCIMQSFKKCSAYSEELFSFLIKNPGTDLSLERLSMDDKRYWLFSGEAAREVFLLSLLYNNIINGVPYKDIDYEKFLLIGI